MLDATLARFEPLVIVAITLAWMIGGVWALNVAQDVVGTRWREAKRWWSGPTDRHTCPACTAQHGASGDTPAPDCINPDGCRCVVATDQARART